MTNSSPKGKPRKPKQIQGWPPRYLSPVDPAAIKRGRGNDVIAFIEAMCRITKDSIAGHAGDLIVLRDWQKELIRHLFAEDVNGKLLHKVALIGMPRKNGKSALLGGITLEHLVFGVQGGEAYSCAAEKEQAKIIFDTVKQMIGLDDELKDFLVPLKDVISNPKSNSVYRALSAEAFTKEGLNPTFTAFDELHAQPDRTLWDVMGLAQGARVEPMLCAVTTAGVKTDSSGKDSICYQTYQYGLKLVSGEIVDPTFFFAWWGASEDADYRLEETWREANPGFDDIISASDFQSVIKRTTEAEFKTKRLNIWTSTSDVWLPHGSWDAIESDREVEDAIDVVLGFDGSFNGDCTAIMGVTVEETPHIFPIAVWEKPDGEGADWQVPVQDVEDAIRNACTCWQVLEISCDPYRWARTYQVLEDEGLPIVTFPQTATRMTPATTRFFEAVVNKQITHSIDPQFARHVESCTLKVDQRGSRLAKEKRGSARRIDMAVASVMALERASWWHSQGGNLPMIFDPWASEGGSNAQADNSLPQ